MQLKPSRSFRTLLLQEMRQVTHAKDRRSALYRHKGQKQQRHHKRQCAPQLFSLFHIKKSPSCCFFCGYCLPTGKKYAKPHAFAAPDRRIFFSSCLRGKMQRIFQKSIDFSNASRYTWTAALNGHKVSKAFEAFRTPPTPYGRLYNGEHV